MDLLESQKLTKTVVDWRKLTQAELKAMFGKLKIEHRANSPSETSAYELLKSNIGYQFGVPFKVGFKFPRHMVFVHKGVGGGNTSNRTAKEWFNPVIDKNVQKLADELAEDYGELAVKNINIR